MNLTNIVGVIQIVVGLVGFFVPAIGTVAGTALIALGLSTLGIRNAVSSVQLGGANAKGIW